MLLCGESNSKLNHMKVRTILFAALSLAALHVNAQRIKGSDTVLPVAQQTAERFMALNPDARVTVTGGGTGVGISALLDGTTDIAMAYKENMYHTGNSFSRACSCPFCYCMYPSIYNKTTGEYKITRTGV